MSHLVEVAIPVDAKVADKLRDPQQREAVGRMLEPDGGIERLMAAIVRLKADAHVRGLTDALVDEELAAYNAERRAWRLTHRHWSAP
jgi:hypothetical protein